MRQKRVNRQNNTLREREKINRTETADTIFKSKNKTQAAFANVKIYLNINKGYTTIHKIW